MIWLALAERQFSPIHPLQSVLHTYQYHPLDNEQKDGIDVFHYLLLSEFPDQFLHFFSWPEECNTMILD